jgi:hypothetical protein
MSRHSTKTQKHDIVLGVDRPLNHVFASVFNQKGEAARGFDPFSWFSPDEDGVNQAIATVEKFTKCKLPASMKDALVADLDTMRQGGDINYAKAHPA